MHFFVSCVVFDYWLFFLVLSVTIIYSFVVVFLCRAQAKRLLVVILLRVIICNKNAEKNNDARTK